MQQQYGFIKLSSAEFLNWISAQSISRACVRVQQHHTWKPRYSGFNGGNHFAMQRNMKHYHMNTNGWSDIGQHFSIFPDGVILTGRPLNVSPACIYGANSGAICIENVGNFDSGGDNMRSDQAASIFSTTGAILKKIGISTPTKANVVYHHWYNGSGGLVYHNSGQKSCPGTAFFGGNKLADYEANFLPKLRTAMVAGGAIAPVGLLDWAVVTADSLNIRKGPQSSFGLTSKQGSLQFGSVIRVYEVSANGWFRISQSRQYWVYGRHTKPAQQAVVNSEDTNARIGAGTEFDVERIYQPGDRVFIFGEDGSWQQIDDDLWIHKTLLDVM